MKLYGYIMCAALPALVLTGCSTTRILAEDEYRLVRNHLVVQGEGKDIAVSDLSPYIMQQTGSFSLGWNPFVSIYNWSDGSDKPLSRLWKKIGQAPVVFNPSMVGPSCDNISNHLEYLGYYNSSVTARVLTKDKKATVQYVIVPGRRYRIDEIIYSVPEAEQFRKIFDADKKNSIINVGNFLSESDLELETSRGTSYFRDNGYYNFNKGAYSFVADTVSVPGRLTLRYSINTDTSVFRFGNVSVSLSESLPFKDGILLRLNTVRPDALYRESVVNNTYSRLSALRVFNGISINMTPVDSNTVDCRINLTESQIKGLKINLEASSNSTGLLGVSPQINFYHKNIFHGAEWLNVNFTGNFQQMLDDASVHSNEAGISASLSFPEFLGLPQKWFDGPNVPRTEFNTTFNYQNRPEYTRLLGSFSFGYTGVVNRALSYQLYPIQISYVDLANIDAAFSETLEGNPFMRYSYQDHFDAGSGGVLLYRTNNDIVPKTPYHYLRIGFDVSGNIISLFRKDKPVFGVPYAQYARLETSFGKTFRWGRENGQSLATRFFAGFGYAYGNSSALPFEKQFYCGGSSSLRGWQARSVGPGFSPVNKSFVIPSQTGDTRLEANIEYRFKMFWKFEGSLFSDIGNVWNIADMKSDFYKSLAADWGAGLRVDLDFILLRLDAGFKVHDPSRDESSRWVRPSEWFRGDGFAVHFGVGYPF